MIRFTFLLLFFLVLPCLSFSKSVQYDIAYIWDDDLDNVLDYQIQLEDLLGSDTAGHLRIVGRTQGGYGIIYDHNGTALSSAQLMVKHSEILRTEGLAECFAVEDSGYYELYNVSYGLGPNLDELKKQYSRVYSYLGNEVGKNLFIEQTTKDNYTLIYRRRGDRSSTYAVAKKHAKLLKRKKISTTIIAEKNHPVVFGESSLLDDERSTAPVAVPADPPPAAPEIAGEVAPAKVESPEYVLSEVAKSRPDTSEAPLEIASAGGDFEASIESFIKELRQKGKLTSDEKTSWIVYDLTREKSIVDINADQVFQAASMIKIGRAHV